jgi:hypothetical protein
MRNSLSIAALAALSAGALFASSARAELIYGAASTDSSTGTSLVSFDSATPHLSTLVGPLAGGVNIRAIDFRPSNGQLYALGYTTAGTLGQLYTVSTSTGVCIPVGAAVALPTLGASTRISIDFNPVTDELRVISGAGGNVRLNPNTGGLIATDPNLATTSIIAGIAYNNNNVGAGTTTAFGYNFSLDQIVTIDGATGVVTTVGPTAPFSAFSADNGMDISGLTGTAYLCMDDFPSPTTLDELYTVNLVTGATTVVPTPNPSSEMAVNLVDLSVAPIPEPATVSLAAVAALGLARRRCRRA